MVAIGIFYPILINAMAGVLEIPKIYFDVGRNFRASRWQMFRTEPEALQALGLVQE